MRSLFSQPLVAALLAALFVAAPEPVSAQCPDCQADWNADGTINGTDLSALLARYGCSTAPGQCGADAPCLDFGGDGTIGVGDLALMLAAFGSPCELADQPEDGAAGFPRHWQGSLPLNKFSTYNIATGNVLTVVPLSGFDPVGPPVSLALYHNSAHAMAGKSGADGQGFDLGLGWSMSYSGRVLGDAAGTQVTVVSDDGREDEFGKVSGVWVAPAGVFDRLQWTQDPQEPNDPNALVWILTSPEQDRRIFDENGLLIREEDSSGNKVRIGRDAENGNRIAFVASAAEGLTDVGDHRIEFFYEEVESVERLGQVAGVTPTRWFDYADDTLATLTFPPLVDDPNFPATPTTYVLFEYDGSGPEGRISQITDRDETIWTYEYDDTPSQQNPDPARLSLVKDWGNNGSNTALFTQIITPTAHHILTNTYKREYTDRRSEVWKTYLSWQVPLLARAVTAEDALGNTTFVTYDTNGNVTSTTDALYRTWNYTYGPVGNVTSVASPLVVDDSDPNNLVYQTWEIDWEQPDATNRPNFWRVTEVRDPLAHWTKYRYEDENDPTLVTQVREMPAVPSGDPNDPNVGVSITTLEYFDDTTPKARGQLKLVTDSNGVKHQFEYDLYGYWSSLLEGLIPEGEPAIPPHIYPTSIAPGVRGSGGQLVSGSTDAGGFSVCFTDSNCNPICVECWWLALLPTPRRLVNEGVLPAGVHSIDAVRGCGDTQFDPLNRVLGATQCLSGPGNTGQRTQSFQYDALGRATVASMEFDQPGAGLNFTRETEFGYTTGEAAGPTTITTPDNDQISLSYDELGRAFSMERGNISQAVEYDAVGRVEFVTNGDGTVAHYVYDVVDRVTEIRHEDDAENVLHKTEYTWNNDNTVATRTETDNVADTVAVVSFDYDARQRLTAETRVEDSVTIYDLSYTYDGLGNRQRKFDAVTRMGTYYEYDSDPANRDPNFQTNNNRLLWYDVYALDPNDDVDDPPAQNKVRTVRYLYYKTGDAANITVKDHYVEGKTPGDPNDYMWWNDLAMYYDKGGKVRMAMRSRWQDDGGGPTDFEYIDAREFMYDSPRQRYLSRPIDPETLTVFANEPNDVPADVQVSWTDYLGESPLSDATVTPQGEVAFSFDPERRYAGDAFQDLDPNGDPQWTRYRHGDLIHSTVLVTQDGDDPVATTAYTAFGELVGGSGFQPENLDTRYQYAGGWGYETGLLEVQGANTSLPAIQLMHVGARWYQPDSGRFVQRDPIGLWGGMNVYDYCAGNPLVAIDPVGLRRIRSLRSATATVKASCVYDDSGTLTGVRVITRIRFVYSVWEDWAETKRGCACGAGVCAGIGIGLRIGAMFLGPVGPFVGGIGYCFTATGMCMGAIGMSLSPTALPDEIEMTTIIDDIPVFPAGPLFGP